MNNRRVGVPVVEFKHLAMATSAKTCLVFDEGTIWTDFAFHGPNCRDGIVGGRHSGARNLKPVPIGFMSSNFCLSSMKEIWGIRFLECL